MKVLTSAANRGGIGEYTVKLPKGLSFAAVVDAAERQMFGMDNPGFCLACGNEQEGCEPDARNYKCEACGEREVFGASEIVMHLS
jgi:hypothetical protein